jgi:hypothetical protein
MVSLDHKVQQAMSVWEASKVSRDFEESRVKQLQVCVAFVLPLVTIVDCSLIGIVVHD